MNILEKVTNDWLGEAIVSPEDWRKSFNIGNCEYAIDEEIFTDSDGLWGSIVIYIYHPDVIEEGFELLISRGENGIDLYIDKLYITKERQGIGIGTRLVSKIIKWAQNHNIYRVIVVADRQTGVYGYYFFATLGFDVDIDDHNYIPEIIRAGLKKEASLCNGKNINKVSDLMKSNKGKSWWRKNGVKATLFFFPNDKESNLSLQKYLSSRESSL